MKLYPLTFEPIFKERIWGGRNLETLYGKPLPPAQPIGESWEICDRPEDQSVIANGPLRGKTLHWLMEEYTDALLGTHRSMPPRFPLLVKILDARQSLSLQVHPPANVAAELGGEPKTEMWYVAQAGPEAELFVGLKHGVNREMFEQKLRSHKVAECIHRIRVKAGDAMFLPSGRVHALGADMVIFEIQQNSDTTYRVFDWNRLDGEGKARKLHVKESLASINFSDFEPGLLSRVTRAASAGTVRHLVNDELFEVAVRTLRAGATLKSAEGRMQIIGVLEGDLRVASAGETLTLRAGQFCLFPARCARCDRRSEHGAKFLQIC
jgi:mannose-6-phosphate isomerase